MLSMPHLVVIFLVALIVLGPEKLPQVARVLGKATAEFRRITGDFRMQIEDEMRDLERQSRLREIETSGSAEPHAEPQAQPQAEPQAEPQIHDSTEIQAAEPEPQLTEIPAAEEGALPVASGTPASSEKPADGEPHSS